MFHRKTNVLLGKPILCLEKTMFCLEKTNVLLRKLIFCIEKPMFFLGKQMSSLEVNNN